MIHYHRESITIDIDYNSHNNNEEHADILENGIFGTVPE